MMCYSGIMPAFFTYKIRCADPDTGRAYFSDVKAMATDTPGIILTEADAVAGHYRLTHRHSGMLITGGKFGMTTDVFGLLMVAKALGKVANWRRHAKSICSVSIGVDTRKVLGEAEIDWIESTPSDAVRRASLQALGMG